MQAFWFGLIGVLWAGYFVLEGFDFGVGMSLPFLAHSDLERRVALRSIGPVWDGNEVWLLVAGGATFAAFPEWYASMFSGFYLAFVLLLIGLILRGIGFEYRGKAHTDSGRAWCDWSVILGSFLPSLLLGVAFANLMRGVKMDARHDMTGGFLALLNPYALLGGVTTLTLFAFHGAVFLTLRTDGGVQAGARRLVTVLAPITAVAAVAFVIWTMTIRGGWVSIALAGVIVVMFVLAALWSRLGSDGRAFSASCITAGLVPVWVFAVLWPDVLPASNNSAFSLTVHNASSTPYTLRVMTVVALVFTPIVLIYQAWTYWVFRARVTGESVASGSGYGLVNRTVAKAQKSARDTLGTPPNPDRPDGPKSGGVGKKPSTTKP